MTNEINPENLKQKKIKCLLWGSGKAFNQYYYVIKHYELLGEISVCGVTSNEPLYAEIGGFAVIEKENIDKTDFDIVIAMALTEEIIADIRCEAIAMGISDYNIVPCTVLGLIGFDFQKYLALKKNPPTIFAPICWGGLTYNRLGLRFDSPLINMFENHDDYIKFLKNPKSYIGSSLKFKEMAWEERLRWEYPIAECDDILLHFNHYTSFKDAEECWNRRKDRIHWDNIFVMFYDEDPQRVDAFMKLPYEKKICFVPYRSNQEGIVSIEYRENKTMKQKPFWEIVNGMASGRWDYYDVLSLLLDGKIRPIAKFKKYL